MLAIDSRSPEALPHDTRLVALERRVRRLSVACVVLAAALLVAATRHDDVLRVRGLIVTDAQGRERIVLGAPLELASSNALIAGATGLLVLDSLGRVAVSAGVNPPLITDGQPSKRISPSNGFTIYDPRTGNERGGFAAFSSGRANMCLDYSAGKEAVCSSVADDDSYTAVMLYGTPNEPQYDRVGMFVGSDGVGVVKAFGGGTQHTGGVTLKAGVGAPQILVHTAAGKPSRDLAAVP